MYVKQLPKGQREQAPTFSLSHKDILNEEGIYEPYGKENYRVVVLMNAVSGATAVFAIELNSRDGVNSIYPDPGKGWGTNKFRRRNDEEIVCDVRANKAEPLENA